MEPNAEEICRFWFDEVGPKGWFEGGEAIDRLIAERYGDACAAALEGRLDAWLCRPEDTLALLILLDQFPRNIHRGRAEAFAADTAGRSAAKRAIALGHDLKLTEAQRHFIYLPLMHSESIEDQDRAVRLYVMRMRQTEAPYLLHALAHRDVIRRFGRFPTRNAALGRTTSPAEQAFLDKGGYGAVVQSLSAA